VKVYHSVPADVARTLSVPELQAYATDKMRNSQEWTATGGTKGENVFFRIPKGSKIYLLEKNGKYYIFTDEAVAIPLGGTV